MDHPVPNYAEQIAQLEATLGLPLPEVARQPLEEKLRLLKVQAAAAGSGQVEIRDSSTNIGPATGVNFGVVQAFYGTQPPADGKELLDSYLGSLIDQHGSLRLGKLLEDARNSREQPNAPTILLRHVYTSMATDKLISGKTFKLSRIAILKAMDAGDPAQVMPEKMRCAVVTMPGERSNSLVAPGSVIHLGSPDLAFEWSAERQRVKAAQEPVNGQWLRPELAVEAVARERRLVLLGDPGSGKSTVLRYLVVALAEALLVGETSGLDHLGWNEIRLPVPLFCPLGMVAKQLDDNPDQDINTLVAALLQPVEAGNLRAGIRPTILQAWRKGSAILFLDGLDEVSTAEEVTRLGKRSRRERIADAIDLLSRPGGRASS